MRREIYSLFLLIVLVFIVNSSFGQASTKGKDFWFGYMYFQGSGATTYISSSSSVTITGTISIPGLSWFHSFLVAPNTIDSITMPIGINPTFTEGIFNLAVHVTTSDTVSVYARGAAGIESDEATVVYPTQALQDNYMVLNWHDSLYTGSSENYGDEFLIVATQDSSQIQIIPTINTPAGHLANIPYTIMLNKGQTYQVVNTNGPVSKRIGSYTGTTIKSLNNKTIAVFSGDKWTSVGNCMFREHLFEQLLPIVCLGKKYILPPIKQRTTTVYIILATQDTTYVSINGNPPFNLNKGNYYRFNTALPSFVSASKPIMLMQFDQGHNCNNDNFGDPFEIMIFPAGQSLKDITFGAFGNPTMDYYWANIVVKTANVSSTILDGINISSAFTPVPSNPAYSYSQDSLSVGTHRLLNPSGALVYVYGWQGLETFGYCAGASLKNLNDTISNTAQTDSTSNILNLPNIITPNGDYINDYLYFKGLSGNNNKLYIYNRWGTMVFQSNDYKNKWAGRDKNGKRLSDGTYYYILNTSSGKTYKRYLTILD